MRLEKEIKSRIDWGLGTIEVSKPAKVLNQNLKPRV